MIRWLRPLALVSLVSLAPACSRGPGDAAEGEPLPLDQLTPEEEASFFLDPTRYPEMQEGRLDTVDMSGQTDDAAWHVQVVNYAPSHIGMTYVFAYVGPEEVAQFAADRQPQLVDDRGNTYDGQLVLDNPRLAIESGSTGVGVYVFQPALIAGADSLTLLINDSTSPVIRIGPWNVERARSQTPALEVRPGS